MLIASDSPEKHPRISLKEKHYIQQSLGKSVAVSRSSKVRENTKVVISSFLIRVYTSCANILLYKRCLSAQSAVAFLPNFEVCLGDRRDAHLCELDDLHLPYKHAVLHQSSPQVRHQIGI